MEANNEIQSLISEFIYAEQEMVRKILTEHIGRPPSRVDYQLTYLTRRIGDPVLRMNYNGQYIGFISIKIDYGEEVKLTLEYHAPHNLKNKE